MRFRKQARRAARRTRYYAGLFERTGIRPWRFGWADIARIPKTPKDALKRDPEAFVCRGARPVLQAMTTGTTGRPTIVHFSRAELEASAALGAIELLILGRLTEEDVVQVCVSSRALLGIDSLVGACARIGASFRLVGLVEPDLALDALTERHSLPGKKPRVSYFSAYASYLGLLVERGLEFGYGPEDFGVERLFVGAEVVTPALKERARRLFGPVEFLERWSMTEVAPFAGVVCSQGHLHFQPGAGLLEIERLDGLGPSGPGELGTLVVTPFLPFRQAAPVLRFDTEDVVRVPAEPPGGELAQLPATSNCLGKLRLAVRHAGGWTFQRDVLEALEAVESVPLPARCGFRPYADGVAVEVAARTTSAAVRHEIERSLEEHGVPVRELRVVAEPAGLERPLPVRADLREVSFASVARASRLAAVAR